MREQNENVEGLSDRERDAWRFVRRFIAREGRSPLLREVAAGLGLRSRGVAHRYVTALVHAGLVQRPVRRHRGIRLADEPGRPTTVLPMLGYIAAGRPIEAVADESEVDLAAFFTGPGRFVLRVRGASMVDAGILDGDMVIVDRTRRAAEGDIVVALIDGNEATLKRLRGNGNGSITLVPANPALTPVTYAAQRIQIQGVVVGQMRAYH
ncbi:MAG: repressor LexA [Chromatiales bacterium 21-64-14]|nr:MAG: repressor LexA [Chromatiales bacterium 21-64-14]HQU15260.1 transcriptional repressor LexA [Gammaproteobacteria bacterium]